MFPNTLLSLDEYWKGTLMRNRIGLFFLSGTTICLKVGINTASMMMVQRWLCWTWQSWMREITRASQRTKLGKANKSSALKSLVRTNERSQRKWVQPRAIRVGESTLRHKEFSFILHRSKRRDMYDLSHLKGTAYPKMKITIGGSLSRHVFSSTKFDWFKPLQYCLKGFTPKMNILHDSLTLVTSNLYD